VEKTKHRARQVEKKRFMTFLQGDYDQRFHVPRRATDEPFTILAGELAGKDIAAEGTGRPGKRRHRSPGCKPKSPLGFGA
jgi:hypothetical protein